MTRTLTNALGGHPLDDATPVLATLDIDIDEAARTTLARALALDAGGRALVSERDDERLAVTRVSARMIDIDGHVTRHKIADANHADKAGTARWADASPPARPEQIALEIETENGTTLSIDTDLAILPTWGASVRTSPVALTRASTLDAKTLTGMLDAAFIDQHIEYNRNNADEHTRLEHREAALLRTARVLAMGTREGDAAALKLMTETLLLGAISAGDETRDTTYTIVIRPPHRNAGDIEVRTDTPSPDDDNASEFDVTVEQQVLERATLRVRGAANAADAMQRAHTQLLEDGADWAESHVVDGTLRTVGAQAVTPPHGPA